MKDRIELEHPIVVDEKTYTEIEMRRPKVRDQLSSQKSAQNQAEAELNLLVEVCELPVEVFHEMDLADYGKCQEKLMVFMIGQEAYDKRFSSLLNGSAVG